MRQKSCKTARFYHIQMKNKLDLQLSPVYTRQIHSDKLQDLVRISLIRLDAIWRLGSIRIKINTQKKVDKY